MITLYQLFNHYGLSPQDVKLVRHSNAEIPILETFRNNIKKLEAYQSIQRPKRFSGASYIAVFAPSIATSALFLGIWEIGNSLKSKDYTPEIHSMIDYHNFPTSWHEEKGEWYNLTRSHLLEDLSERLVIEWGKATVAWVQNKDKKILQIKAKGSIGDFNSYDEVKLDYYSLKNIINDRESNISWVTALSSVNGIYLIKDKKSGKLYVGSAYGENGILGRWSNYSQSGHAGNKDLKELDPVFFEFSILEIVPSTTSADEVIRREGRWKNKLGTREFGLNNN